MQTLHHTMIVNDISYDLQTSPRVIEILDEARKKGERLTIISGDTDTGEPWNTQSGYITHFSMTENDETISFLQIRPLKRSVDENLYPNTILLIRHSNQNKGNPLYCHPRFKPRYKA